MPKFCSNCGDRLDSTDQFCSACGTQIHNQQTGSVLESEIKVGQEILQLLNIQSVVGRWEGQESDSAESTTNRRKGSLLLTKDEFIFIAKVGIFSKKLKSIWRIPLSAIKTVKKMGWPIKAVFITCNQSPKEKGVLKRLMGERHLSFKVQNEESFIFKIKELNPKIQ